MPFARRIGDLAPVWIGSMPWRWILTRSPLGCPSFARSSNARRSAEHHLPWLRKEQPARQLHHAFERPKVLQVQGGILAAFLRPDWDSVCTPSRNLVHKPAV